MTWLDEHPEAVEAAAFKVNSVHHFAGEQCLCGFRSARARSRTEHITAELLTELSAALSAGPEPCPNGPGEVAGRRVGPLGRWTCGGCRMSELRTVYGVRYPDGTVFDEEFDTLAEARDWANEDDEVLTRDVTEWRRVDV